MNQKNKKLSNKSTEIIDLFLDTLWMERGLSKNTLSAYRSDLCKFLLWLEGENIEVDQARSNNILTYLALSEMRLELHVKFQNNLMKGFRENARQNERTDERATPKVSTTSWLSDQKKINK